MQALISAFDISGQLDLIGMAGIVSAMGLFLFRILREQRLEREGRDKLFTDTLDANQDRNEKFWDNHMSKNVQALESVADRLEHVEYELAVHNVEHEGGKTWDLPDPP